jgi:hypothetical protein
VYIYNSNPKDRRDIPEISPRYLLLKLYDFSFLSLVAFTSFIGRKGEVIFFYRNIILHPSEVRKH